MVPIGNGGTLVLPYQKLALLDRGLEDLECSDLVAPSRVSTAPGIHLWFSLLCRASMAAPALLFQWVELNRGKKLARLWPGARR